MTDVPNSPFDPNTSPGPDPQSESTPLVAPKARRVFAEPAEGSDESLYGSEKPALTIVIQSWFTPIIALLMLVLGLVGGFVGRPMLESQFLPTAVPTQITAAQGAAPIPTDAAESAAQRKAVMDSIIKQTIHFMGDENAPITIIEFSDYQCPFCGQFAKNTQGALIEQYVKTGKVRFGYSHFAFLGQESLDAAVASECADEQNKFWEFHDLLFKSQSGENQGAFTQDNLIKLAEQVSLDKTTFSACLTSGKYLDRVQAQTQFAGSNGLTSTPSFLVNGYLIKGAQDISAFKQVIESLLKD